MLKLLFSSRCFLAAIMLPLLCEPVFAQQTFTTYEGYCQGMIQASAPGLTAMIEGLSKADAESEMNTLTDPASIRMVKELIAFYYTHKQPVDPSSIRSELLSLCINKKIFLP